MLQQRAFCSTGANQLRPGPQKQQNSDTERKDITLSGEPQRRGSKSTRMDGTRDAQQCASSSDSARGKAEHSLAINTAEAAFVAKRGRWCMAGEEQATRNRSTTRSIQCIGADEPRLKQRQASWSPSRPPSSVCLVDEQRCTLPTCEPIKVQCTATHSACALLSWRAQPAPTSAFQLHAHEVSCRPDLLPRCRPATCTA